MSYLPHIIEVDGAKFRVAGRNDDPGSPLFGPNEIRTLNNLLKDAGSVMAGNAILAWGDEAPEGFEWTTVITGVHEVQAIFSIGFVESCAFHVPTLIPKAANRDFDFTDADIEALRDRVEVAVESAVAVFAGEPITDGVNE